MSRQLVLSRPSGRRRPPSRPPLASWLSDSLRDARQPAQPAKRSNWACVRSPPSWPL